MFINSETTRSCGFLVPRGYTDPFQLKSENRENFETAPLRQVFSQ